MPRSRGGCFGSLLKLGVFAVLISAIVLASNALFQPWVFYLGGSFHLIPNWQGWGRMKTRTGGEYVVMLDMGPSRPSGRGGASLTGFGYVCTPRHERFRLKLYAGMRRGLGRNTNGETIRVHIYNRSSFDPSDRPSITFEGRWSGDSIVMTDVGSISRAFLADGSLNRGRLPAASDTLPITIAGGSKSGFDAACGKTR